MKILVVEDDENSRILQHYILESANYEVISAENGKEGLALAETHLPDLIISDILMPVMDGYSLCRAIRSSEKLRHIPLIFYTATYTTAKDEQLALDMGATKFIVKPMDPGEFLKHVKHALTENMQAEHRRNQKSPLELEIEYASALARKLEKKVADLEEKQRKLELSEQKYRRLAEALHDNYFFYTYDANGVLTYISPSFTNVLGYSEEDGRQGFMKYLTDTPVNQQAIEKFRFNLQGIRQAQYEVEIRHKDGTLHFLELTEYPVLSKHLRVEHIEGIAHDITERKRIEAEKAKLEESLRRSEKNQALGSLASGIAHDFNNILTGIVGYSELLQASLPKNPLWHSYIEKILKAANRASDLIKQILNFSLRTGQEKRPSEIQTVVREALQLMRASIPSKIEIRTEIDAACPRVMADTTQIYEVLINLCTNAYHAMRDQNDGILKVVLSADRVESDNGMKSGDYVRLEITDTGCGIEKNLLDRIFEPYFTTKPPGEGTGIGLAVVSGIVRNHNGYIRVCSEPRKGATFRIYLPVAMPDDTGEKPDFDTDVPYLITV